MPILADKITLSQPEGADYADQITTGTSYGPVNMSYVPQPLFTNQRYTYRVLQTIQMKVILLWVWAEGAVLGRAKTALKFKYEI